MNIFDWLSLLRGIMFFWLSMTAFSISQLYVDGYRTAKRESGIIKALINILYCMSLIFLHLAITAFVLGFGLRNVHQYVVATMPVTMLPLGFLLTKFRKESVSTNDPK